MIYLLDTNIVSYWMRGDKKIIKKIRSYQPSDLSITAITLAEIYYGIEKSQVRTKERHHKIEQIRSQLEIYPFDESAAHRYSIIRSKLERQGCVISERDLQIASIAMAHQLALVTDNVKEFTRIANLSVEDWA